jgi:undecaprenyl-diphosphatase
MMTVVAQQFVRFDLLILETLARCHRSDGAVRLIRWVSHAADGHIYPLVLILVAALQPNRWEVFSIFVLSFALELAAYKLIKQFVKRPRPFQKHAGIVHLIAPSDFFSFPSGHTAGAFVVAISVVSCYPGLSFLLYAWAALVGFSRVYLGVHYPTDVLAGAGLGILSVKAAVLLGTCLYSSIF